VSRAKEGKRSGREGTSERSSKRNDEHSGEPRDYVRGPHIYLRGATWYSYVPGASPLRASLNTSDRAEADRAHAARVLQGPRGSAASAPEPLPLDVLVDRFLAADHDWTPRSKKSARSRVMMFLRWCADQSPPVERPGDITDDVLDAWKKSRRESTTREGNSLGVTTLARDWKMVRRFFRWCFQRDLAPRVVALLDRSPPRELRRLSAGIIPSPAEAGKVARHLRANGQQGAALALVVLLATGLRLSELRELPAENITDDAIKSPPGKGKREREIPVAREVADAARAFVARRDAPRGRGRNVTDEGVTLDDHWSARILRPACKAVGVPAFGAHDMRRTFVTECVRAGVDILTVQRWVAHISVTTTQRYLGRYRDEKPRKVPTPAALTIVTKGRKR
jgi:integrase